MDNKVDITDSEFMALCAERDRLCDNRVSSSSYVDDAEIEKWLNKRIPIIQSYLKEKGELASGLKPVYELWTCGEISEQSLNAIAKIKATVHKYEIRVFNAQAILDEAKNSVNKSVIDLLQRVYMQPLALLKAKKAASVDAKRHANLPPRSLAAYHQFQQSSS